MAQNRGNREGTLGSVEGILYILVINNFYVPNCSTVRVYIVSFHPAKIHKVKCYLMIK